MSKEEVVTPVKEFEMKDSGVKQAFSTGAMRDTAEGKRWWHLVSPYLIQYLGIPPFATKENLDAAIQDIAWFQISKNPASLISAFSHLDGVYEDMIEWLEKGAVKYAKRNWEAGIPISRCMDSLWRHIKSMKEGKTDENHKAAAKCNIMFILHYMCVIRDGTMNPEIDDLPRYMATSVEGGVKS